MLTFATVAIHLDGLQDSIANHNTMKVIGAQRKASLKLTVPLAYPIK